MVPRFADTCLRFTPVFQHLLRCCLGFAEDNSGTNYSLFSLPLTPHPSLIMLHNITEHSFPPFSIKQLLNSRISPYNLFYYLYRKLIFPFSHSFYRNNDLQFILHPFQIGRCCHFRTSQNFDYSRIPKNLCPDFLI